MSATGNADQIVFWNTDAGHRWVILQDRIDAVMAPLSARLLDVACVNNGEQVLDIGCGCGTTTMALAQRVGVRGSVLGVDISRPMLDRAERRIAAEALSNVETVQADASSHAFAAGTIDLAFSRFGVMFFDDPMGAFANIRRALRPGGRLAFMCWRQMAENPFFTVPFLAAKPFLTPLPPPDPLAPGPFAFADADRVRAILGSAGFTEVAVAPFDALLSLGGTEAATDYAVQMGPTTRALAESTPEQRALAEAAVAEALARHAGPGGVALGSAVWLVTARV